MEEDNPWEGILAATMYAMKATYHTTLKATPMQLVFGRDAILNTKFEADWKVISQNKQEMINKNNQRENARRLPHQYKKGDKILHQADWHYKFGSDPYSGPFTIRKVNNNGTVVIKKDSVLETVNIRTIKPYHS